MSRLVLALEAELLHEYVVEYCTQLGARRFVLFADLIYGFRSSSLVGHAVLLHEEILDYCFLLFLVGTAY